MHAAVMRDGVTDAVPVEEPLEIRVDGRAARGHDAHPGRRRGAGPRLPVRRGADRPSPRDAGPSRDLAANVVEVRRAADARPGRARSFYTTSSCGVCGKGALEEVAVRSDPLPAGPVVAARAARAACPTTCCSRASSAPAACTRPDCSKPTAHRCWCARTSAGTTRWTRSSAARCWMVCVPLHGQHPVRQRPAVVRAGAEGGRRRRTDPGRRRSADVARGVAGGRARPDAVRLRPRRPHERLHAPGPGGRRPRMIRSGPFSFAAVSGEVAERLKAAAC